jgi:Ca2+-binding EF-hand superfamily protein
MSIRRTAAALLLLLALPLAGRAQPQAAAPALPSDNEVNDAFARMDSNRDGQLSLEEFENGIARPFGSQREGVVYQKLPARFRVLDADADGFLDAGEYANLAQRWQGAGAAPPPLAQADQNHDGRIDFREFAALHRPADDDSAPADASATAANPTRR